MMVIDQGRVLLDGTVAAFKASHGTQRTLVVDLDRAEVPLPITVGEVIKVEGPRQWIRFDRRETTAAEMVAAVTALGTIRDLSIEEPEIEDLVRRLYRSGEANGGAPD